MANEWAITAAVRPNRASSHAPIINSSRRWPSAQRPPTPGLG